MKRNMLDRLQKRLEERIREQTDCLLETDVSQYSLIPQEDDLSEVSLASNSTDTLPFLYEMFYFIFIDSRCH